MKKLLKYPNLIEDLIKHTYGFAKISIFIHINPDFDALGSAFFLARFLKLNTFGNQIKIIGINKVIEEDFKNFFDIDNQPIDDEYIKDSLAFVLDTANSQRILSQKHTLAKKIVLVDHHIKADDFADISYIDDESIATCEMLAYSLMTISKTKEQQTFFYDTKALNYLLLGITTDSNRFMYDKTSEITHEIASWLIQNNVNPTKIYNQLYSRDLQQLKIDGWMISQIQLDGEIGYIVVGDDWDDKWNFSNWTDKVYLLANVKEIKIWFITKYDTIKKHYKISLRSSIYSVVDVANKYNGGGHKLASGCYIDDLSQLPQFILDLKNLIK